MAVARLQSRHCSLLNSCLARSIKFLAAEEIFLDEVMAQTSTGTPVQLGSNRVKDFSLSPKGIGKSAAPRPSFAAIKAACVVSVLKDHFFTDTLYFCPSEPVRFQDEAFPF